VGGVKWREAATAAATSPTGGRSREPAGLAHVTSLPSSGLCRPTPVVATLGSLRRLGGGLARQPSRLPGEPDDKVILDYIQGNHYTWSKWLGVLNVSESSSGQARAEAVSTARDPKRHDRITRREFWRSQHPEFRAKCAPNNCQPPSCASRCVLNAPAVCLSDTVATTCGVTCTVPVL
jgi:hypothetical protein